MVYIARGFFSILLVSFLFFGNIRPTPEVETLQEKDPKDEIIKFLKQACEDRSTKKQKKPTGPYSWGTPRSQGTPVPHQEKDRLRQTGKAKESETDGPTTNYGTGILPPKKDQQGCFSGLLKFLPCLGKK